MDQRGQVCVALHALVLPSGGRVTRGDRVRLHPDDRGDPVDAALMGRIARIATIEQDVAGCRFVGVVIDDAADGESGKRRYPGHQFFLAPGELESLGNVSIETQDASPPRILIAGIGDVLKGDSGFGVEVLNHLSRLTLPSGVRLFNAGLRSFDLAYALMDGPPHTILVHSCTRGLPPGTVIQLDAEFDDEAACTATGHDLDPVKVLRLARSLGAILRDVTVIGCEPLAFGTDVETRLSREVADAVPVAVSIIMEMVERLLAAGSLQELATSGAHQPA